MSEEITAKYFTVLGCCSFCDACPCSTESVNSLSIWKDRLHLLTCHLFGSMRFALVVFFGCVWCVIRVVVVECQSCLTLLWTFLILNLQLQT